jgi:hypothetical protein
MVTRRHTRPLILALALIGGAAAVAPFAHRWLLAGIELYGATSPDPLPAATLPPGEQAKLQGRLAAFRSAVEARRPGAPLVLSVDEVNALLAVAPGLGGRLRVEIDGDRVRARFSLPLEDLGFPQWRGRFLNGTCLLNLSVVDGELVVSPEAIEVKTGPLPGPIQARLRRANLARLAFRDPKVARSLRRLGSVEARGGKITIRAR